MEFARACQRVIDTIDARLTDTGSSSSSGGGGRSVLGVEGRITYLHLKGEHHVRIAQALLDDKEVRATAPPSRPASAADDGSGGDDGTMTADEAALTSERQFDAAHAAYAAAEREAAVGLGDNPRHPLRIHCALKLCEVLAHAHAHTLFFETRSCRSHVVESSRAGRLRTTPRHRVACRVCDAARRSRTTHAPPLSLCRSESTLHLAPRCCRPMVPRGRDGAHGRRRRRAPAEQRAQPWRGHARGARGVGGGVARIRGTPPR